MEQREFAHCCAFLISYNVTKSRPFSRSSSALRKTALHRLICVASVTAQCDLLCEIIPVSGRVQRTDKARPTADPGLHQGWETLQLSTI